MKKKDQSSESIRKLVEADLESCPQLAVEDGPMIKRPKANEGHDEGGRVRLEVQSNWVFHETFDDPTSTAEEFGRERGLTEKQIEAITVQLTQASMSGCQRNHEIKDAYHYMAVGLEEGCQWLNGDTLTHIMINKTVVDNFIRHERSRIQHYVQCTFRLNCCNSLLFNWEEDSRNTNGRQPFKNVSEFVLGLQASWIGEPKTALLELLGCRKLAFDWIRIGKAKGLPPSLNNEILKYYLPEALVPIVLYWKAYKARHRSSHAMAAIKSFPPPFSSSPDHPAIRNLELIMAVLSDNLSSDVSAEDFLYFLLSLCNNQAIAPGGKWDPRSKRVSYYPVEDVDDWNRIEN